MGRKKKKMKKGITDGEDMISNLPESLIHHILSFLLIKDVIRTCLLSKRWRNIWKSLPVLNFGRVRHEEFLDQFLARYEGQKVKKIQFELSECIEARRLEPWVHFAAMHGVEELDMYAGVLKDSNRMLPLVECLELRVLRIILDGCFPQPFRFPMLTKLHFTAIKCNYLDTSACPLLEDLIIEGTFASDSLEIHAPNPKLRYLDISESEAYEDDSRLSLYAPCLLHLEFKVSFLRFYEFKDISSVKTLRLKSSVYANMNAMAESVVRLLRNLTHVKSLKLCRKCILVLAYGGMIGLEIPSLSATCLELETNLSRFLLLGITSLLRASRCIERLIINMNDCTGPDEWLIFEGHDIDAVEVWESLEHVLSIELALNTILIQNYPGYDVYNCYWSTRTWEPSTEEVLEYCEFEIKLVEVLLKSCKMLNKMNISTIKPFSQPFTLPLELKFLYGLTKALLVFPRSSVNAEVYFS